MRIKSKAINLCITDDEYKGHEAFTIHFEVIQGDLLRTTKEYSLTYVPKTDEWLGDVIAYGHWWDLRPDEVLQLREVYNMDAFIQDLLYCEEYLKPSICHNVL